MDGPRGLRSPSAVLPQRRCPRPPWDRLGGDCPGSRRSQPEEATRDRGRGAAGGAGPAPPAPLSLRSAARLGGGERWQMAGGRGRPLPLGTAPSIDSNPPLPSTAGRWVKKWVRGQRRTDDGEMWVTTSYSLYVCGKGEGR